MRRPLALTCVVFLAFIGSAVAADEWIDLFDGRSLDDWKASENPASFKVDEGRIACDGPRAHLFYAGPVNKGEFKNFELHVEALARPGANSGVYFHTAWQASGFPAKGFEVQINNSYVGHGNYRELKKTGSLYGYRNQYKSLVADDEWCTLWISVRGRRVQVKVNDALVVDYLEPANPVADPKRDRQLGRGTFALQCHDAGSKVLFRKVRVKPLPDDLPVDPAPPCDDVDRQIIQLSQQNFPVVNLHAHLKGGLTLDEVLENSRQTGIFYGVALNCGKGFPITDDASAEKWFESIKGKPVFVGMQAEGREWVTMFSKETIAKFDYVFTDSMTFTDARGRRTRLWIPAEVDVPDAEAFMDMLVEKAVGILSNEPIDIYVNPTFLPDVIAKDYDKLWTEPRMRRVIDAAVAHHVAIEINDRYRLPSPAFIKLAKGKGAKFSFGVNNGDRQLGRLEYCLKMVKECGLTGGDMFVPRPAGSKK